MKERALIYMMSATIGATGATAYTVVSGEPASEQHSVVYSAAQILSTDQTQLNIEESRLTYEETGIDVSTLYQYDDDDLSDYLYVDGNANDARLTLEEVAMVLSGLEQVYPSGTAWTNDTYYRCNGKGYATGGFGCAAFAYMVSDTLYGTADYHKLSNSDYLQPYDVAELYGGQHTVFVLNINNDNTITVAEANVNGVVRWGSVYSFDDVTGVLKRY
jgi:hypothetical protein